MHAVLLLLSLLIFHEEQSIVIPQDNKPFTIEMKDIVRIRATGIAGSQIDFKVEGNAKVARINNVIQKAGSKALLGSTIRELEVVPTRTGSTKVIVTVKSPNSPKAEHVEYQFETK